MKGVVYDTGVLIAAEKGERSIWAEHRVLLEAGVVPCVPAPVIAQARRSPRQVQMRRFLCGCEIVPFTEDDAHRTGALLAKARTSDVVDAALVVLAIERGANIHTADGGDIQHLSRAARAKISISGV